MARPIQEVIAALFAGDPVTPNDVKRLSRHLREVQQGDRFLSERNPFPGDELVTLGEAFAAYRKNILRNLHRYTLDELRGYICELLVIVEGYVDLLAAQEGIDRRSHKNRSRGAREAAAAKRIETEAIRDAIADLRSAHGLKISDAVRKYLRDGNEAWWATATHEERERKVRATLRRLRRRKKSGR